ncbi:MAG: serine/threonine-protein phosphatase [bacterium]|nr:serine/threonine-protein phosphatase [bacterium]
MSKPRKYLRDARGFVRHYTAGLNVRDLKRLFGEDASKAYRVLSRDQDAPPEGTDEVLGFFRRTKILFIGISRRLSPARRLIFAVSVLATILGLLGGKDLTLGGSNTMISVGTASLYLIAAIVGFAFLFIMELVDRIRVRDELEVARQLQAELLPQRAPVVPGYAFAHSYRTANEVGGDYYDVSSLPDGRLALVIGDASGHGIAAGLLMAIANATLKTALEVDPAPDKVAQLLNSTLHRTGDRRAFMSLFYALLEPATGVVDFVCAGHPFPLLRRRDGSIVELGSGALPLGMRAELELPIQRTDLRPGETLLLFTDGLPEALDAQEHSFGFPRLEQLAANGGSAARVHDSVVRAFKAHIGNRDLADDVTLLVVSRAPE